MTTNSASHNVGYAHQEPIKAPDWHALVAWDMLFNGLTTGLFLVAALSELVAPDLFAPVARVAYPVALVFLLMDLLFLVLDLGDVWRFHHMLRVFKPGSPMSFGVWSLTVYSLPLTVAALLSLLPVDGILEGVRLTSIVLGLIPALASAVYKGVLLSTSAQPGWKDARWLGGYHTSGAVVLGCAEMIGLAYMLGQLRPAEVLKPALGILLVVHALASVLLAIELWPSKNRVSPHKAWRWTFVMTAASSFVLPLALVILSSASVALLIAVAWIILGNLVARFLLVQLPHSSTWTSRTA